MKWLIVTIGTGTRVMLIFLSLVKTSITDIVGNKFLLVTNWNVLALRKSWFGHSGVFHSLSPQTQ